MSTSTTDPWAPVVGQPDAVAQLRAAVASPVHAYLFVGPAGSGKRAALRAFAGELLLAAADPAGDPDPLRIRSLAAAEQHPDLVVIDPEGTQFRGGKVPSGGETEASRFQREAYRSPVEGSRKVVAATSFETANPPAVGALLKTLEEPPASAVLVLLAEHIPPEQVTVASRCQRVEFRPVPEPVIAERLVTEGIEPAVAAEAASLANGDVSRAHLLATDDRLQLRVEAWAAVPRRLDGRGATVAALVDDLRAMIDDAQTPLDSRQRQEVAEVADQIERYGQRGSGARELDALHRRQRRALRTAELRMGLATLARAYRDHLATVADPEPLLAAEAAIQDVAEELIRNPNEELMLQALLLRLPPLQT